MPDPTPPNSGTPKNDDSTPSGDGPGSQAVPVIGIIGLTAYLAIAIVVCLYD